ncbi:MAG: NAD(P)H-binding protein, partial [Geitlerinemataceae cyanobacterium]
RPGRPGLNLAEEPPAVRMNDQLGGILTWKLRGEDSVRDSGIPYTIVRPCALTEETGGKVLIADRGDTIKGKCSRDDIADLCVRAIENPQASNVTFEVKEAETQSKDSQNWDEFFASLQSDRSVTSV